MTLDGHFSHICQGGRATEGYSLPHLPIKTLDYEYHHATGVTVETAVEVLMSLLSSVLTAAAT